MTNDIKIHKFQTLSNTCEKETAELLTEAMTEKFQSAIIFGFKNGEIFIRHTISKGRLEIIGALEAAKIQLWE